MKVFLSNVVVSFLLIATGRALAAPSPALDDFNHYQWNRANFILKNGKTDTQPWYEWWYYKVVLPESAESFYAVYGVVNPWDLHSSLAGTRSYVGFGDFSKKIMIDQKYSLQQFNASYDKMDVRIGERNSANDQHFEGELTDSIYGTEKWNIVIKKKWSFNAMGWAMKIPHITNIAWFPAQADATCSGTIESAGKVHTFKDAPCYQDRNWGNSFPDWWTWIVSNHFNEEKDAVLAVGGGLPEILGQKKFASVSVGFKFRGKVYSFRPNDLDIVHSHIKWGEWLVSAQNSKIRIEIEASAPREKFMDLQFMMPKGEVFHDYETLTGHLVVRVYQKAKNSSGYVFTGELTSDEAGIEYGSKNANKMHLEMLNSK